MARGLHRSSPPGIAALAAVTRGSIFNLPMMMDGRITGAAAVQSALSGRGA